MASLTPESSSRKSEQNGGRVTTVSLDDGRHLTYTEYGYSNGIPVVFLHGIPGSRQLGRLFETAAQAHRIRLLALDRPGYGRSSPWANRSVSDASKFIGSVLDHASIQTARIIAFSGGSPYALAAATTHADRLDRVDIVAGATPPDLSEETPLTQRLLAGLATTSPAILRGLLRGQSWLAERLNPSFVVGQYTTEDADEAVPDDTAEIVKEDFVEAFAHHRHGAVTEFRQTATDWKINFGEIDEEVCFWHGENDTNVPIADARRLESRLPTAQLYVLDNADHLQTLLRSVPDILAAYREDDCAVSDKC